MMMDLREPVSALSHGLGMLLAFPVTALLWRRSGTSTSTRPAGSSREVAAPQPPPAWPRRGAGPLLSFEQGKRLSLAIFGATAAACYGASAAFHGARVDDEQLDLLRRLDYIGIYLLIAGTYTPGAWALMTGSMRRGTLAAVWGVALACSARVWLGGTLPVLVSTAVYLAMGWGVLFCYRELARRHGHRKLLPLPLGGVFYSVGAVINLAGWPVLDEGLFGAHELFHFFVLAGTACHVHFMLRAVIPAAPAPGEAENWAAAWPGMDVDVPIRPGLELAGEANGVL